MNAAELIEQVAALPPEERLLFERLLRVMNNAVPSGGESTGGEWPDFGERLHRIYGDRISSDSKSIVAEGRGDR